MSQVTRPQSPIKDYGVLLGFLVLCLGVGRIGGWITQPAIDAWYRDLDKPAFTPPDIAFPIAWTLLYIAMAVAAWLVWRSPAEPQQRRGALTLFFSQLALNLAWSFLFFGARSPLLGLLDIVVLLILIVLTLRAFLPINRIAGLLFVPYLIWVAYAVVLNASIVAMN